MFAGYGRNGKDKFAHWFNKHWQRRSKCQFTNTIDTCTKWFRRTIKFIATGPSQHHPKTLFAVSIAIITPSHITYRFVSTCTNNTNAQLFFSLFRFFSHFRSKKVITSLRNINYLTIYLKWMKSKFDMGEDLLFTKKTSRFLSVYVVYLIISRRRIVLYVSRVD